MNHVLKTIEDAQTKLRLVEEEAVRLKLFINQCCDFAAIPHLYSQVEPAGALETALTVARNSYYGRPLTTCVRDYLLMREKSSGKASPAPLDEIFNALKLGGYDLAASSNNADDQKRGVAISLGKNSSTFVRLPTGDWGLLEWYPNVREKKKKNGESQDKNTAEGNLADASGDVSGGTESDQSASLTGSENTEVKM